jgi:hypothetical protein
MNIQDVSKRAVQWYSKCFCVPSVTKIFRLKAYKRSIVQYADKVVRKESCIPMIYRIQDKRFLGSVILSDESTFHVSGKANTHNCRLWGSENPRDSPKVNVRVFCDHYRYRVSGHAPTVSHSTVRRR